ncbi:hypothetical protein QBC36DRAFT_293567 [Triangularia setosa]|uniref:Uncharacterized protein n=1 Tax=Triangularia setosa TaxID=2587417 RepID=A0AAN7A422_9PEZI|nr:hypothetical protein QBC36DRAFT_293567 [Podospora setosa]
MSSSVISVTSSDLSTDPSSTARNAGAVPDPEEEEERRRRVAFQLGEDSTRYISKSLEWAIDKLQTYISLMEDSPVYWSALILHPGFKTKWIEQYLEEERASRIKIEFQTFFERDYPAQHPASAPTPAPAPAPGSRHPTQNHLIQHDSYSPEPEDIPVQPRWLG